MKLKFTFISYLFLFCLSSLYSFGQPKMDSIRKLVFEIDQQILEIDSIEKLKTTPASIGCGDDGSFYMVGDFENIIYKTIDFSSTKGFDETIYYNEKNDKIYQSKVYHHSFEEATYWFNNEIIKKEEIGDKSILKKEKEISPIIGDSRSFIETEIKSKMIKDLPNIIYVHVPNVNDESLFVKSSNGRAVKDISTSDTRFIVYPKGERVAKIDVFKIIENDTIPVDHHYIRVVNISSFFKAYVAGENNGTVHKNSLKHAIGIAARNVELNHCLKATINQYKVIILRNEEVVYTEVCYSAYLSEKIKSKFKELVTGDELYFVDLSIRFGKDSNMPIESIKLTVE